MRKTCLLLILLGLLLNIPAQSVSINTGFVARYICPGTPVSVPFSTSGSFGAGNVFIAQLSDKNGSFYTPRVIGTLPGPIAADINSSIPANVIAGMFYKIRVISTDPADTGTEDDSYIVIEPMPSAPVVTASSGCLGHDTIYIAGAKGVQTLQLFFNDSLISTIANDSIYTSSTIAGGNGNGSAHNQLSNPYGVFVDGVGNTYVADAANNRVLKFAAGSDSSTNGVIVAGGNGAGNAANQLNGPYFVFLDDSENLYVSDVNNYRVQKFPPGSDSTTNGVTVAGGNGTGAGHNQLGEPRGLFIDAHKNLFVADKANNRIMKFPPQSNSSTAGTIVAAGNGTGSANNQLNGPRGIWEDEKGDIYVADYANNRVMRFVFGGDSTIQGFIAAGGNGLGSASNQFNKPYGVYLDGNEDTYVVDVYNNRVQKFPRGSNSTTNGITVVGGNGAGNMANQFNEPNEIFIDGYGSIYVVDYLNTRVQKSIFSVADTSYVPLAQGKYAFTYTSTYGCRSLLSNPINVYSASASGISQTICHGESFLGRTETGLYIDTLSNANGCDSIRTLNLLVNEVSNANISQTICAGDSFLGRNSTGLYNDTLTSANGCDSIRTLNLTVNPANTSNVSQSICYGTVYMFNGKALSESGNYADTLTSVLGCDSIINLTLITSILRTEISDTACAGTAFQFNSHNLTHTGIYSDTLQTLEGCDSLVTLRLFVDSPSTPTITRTQNVLSTDSFSFYAWFLNDSVIAGASQRSVAINQNGNYRVAVTTAIGCTDTSLLYSVLDLGVSQKITPGEVKLYPNPNNGIFTLVFQGETVSDVEVTDALGRVFTKAKVDHQHQFNLAQLTQGIYFIQFNSNHVFGTLKFSVEH